ncbi:hypothetical protein [Burkholderia gladioli]|uniref:hypothetical protein n=1 Tax=Burkholderia gladioli TaxID=28095 RepID=UPI001364D3FF|nr:hypothetical protein [Burkholderia gladioli]
MAQPDKRPPLKIHMTTREMRSPSPGDAAEAIADIATAFAIALHQNGVLPLSSVTNTLGNVLDTAARKRPDEGSNPIVQTVYNMFLTMESMIPEFGTEDSDEDNNSQNSA